jgi:hypothetical protein
VKRGVSKLQKKKKKKKEVKEECRAFDDVPTTAAIIDRVRRTTQ